MYKNYDIDTLVIYFLTDRKRRTLQELYKIIPKKYNETIEEYIKRIKRINKQT